MGFPSVPVCNGAISSVCSSIRNVPPRWARNCCGIFSACSRLPSSDMRLIPAIDLRAGHCVRLLHGDFDAETRYPDDPYSLLAKYREAGADWLHIVDLDGARDGSLGNRAIIVELAARRALNLQVGGGLRDTAALAQMFDAGVSRAVVGSAAISQIEQVQGWLAQFG